MRKSWAHSISESAKRQGNLLRRIRESSGLTMRQLAMQVGISHSAISQLEHGKLELPRARVEQIIKACGHSVEDFDRLVGKKTIPINYREECLSLVRRMEEEDLMLLFKLMSKLVAGQNGEIHEQKVGIA